jgi:exodeoxyribonuclease I
MSASGADTFLWHDYETTGADSRRDRPSQFAGIRTDMALRPIGDPVVAFCQPAPDVLPHPGASLITGITPQQCARDGVRESEFAAIVHDALAQPGTCGAGYNSIRFDDEFTRQLLYRNFYDPYAREWERGNSRWDLIDLLRFCYALRPDGIAWPMRDDGTASFRLEDLARENGLSHTRAHDALSDVEATIALARAVRDAQPRLFDWYLTLRSKREAVKLLDWTTPTPVLHVSSRYPAARGCLAMVVPLAPHPRQNNGVIVFDLSGDPEELDTLGVDEIRDRLFTPRADLPEGVERVPLKVVHTNRCPALAPVRALQGVDLKRIGLDPDRCRANLERLPDLVALRSKLQAVFNEADRADATMLDADLALYGSFLGDADRALLREIRATPPERLATLPPPFRDARCNTMLFRYRARNWPDTLRADELTAWRAHRHARLIDDRGLAGLNREQSLALITSLRTERATPRDFAILDALESWTLALTQDLMP